MFRILDKPPKELLMWFPKSFVNPYTKEYFLTLKTDYWLIHESYNAACSLRVDRAWAYIQYFAVRRKVLRTGLGTQLMNQLKVLHPKLHLDVQHQNYRAIQFYVKQDFIPYAWDSATISCKYEKEKEE